MIEAVRYGVVLLLLTGCAIDQTERYNNQVAEIEAREVFERQQAECSALGGVMVVRKRHIGRADPSLEYGTATCHFLP